MSQQRILDARVSLPPPPPLPVLPLVPGQSIVVDMGATTRVGSSPAGGIVDDSGGSALGLGGTSWNAGAGLTMKWKALRFSVEGTWQSFSALGGLDFSKDWFGLVLYTGGGFGPISQELTLRQTWVEPIWPDTSDTVVSFSGTTWGTSRFFGAAVAYGPETFQPFVSGRFSIGPDVDGAKLSHTGVPAGNAIWMDQRSLDFGVRSSWTPDLSVIGGCGFRSFSDKRIHGSEWRAFAGISYALARSPVFREEED